ncbi:methyl-accepting chemotaxis protein [Undibacterium sp. TC4M20W]|uniref:methyl-accepting chemotaxis protein n=1 Tax=Undibacterium sp. TC4M20W TaxID=3413052 RepID=UPI003BF055D8
MSIRSKLMITFAALAAVVLIVAGLSLNSLANADRQFSSYVHGLMARGSVAEKFRRAVDERAVAVRNLALVTKPADFDIEKAVVTSAHQRVQTHLAKLKAMLAQASDVSEKGRAMVAEMDRLETAYTPVALDIVKMALENKREAAITKMNEECRPLLAAIVKVSNDYSEVVQVRSEELVKTAEDTYAARRNLLISLCVLAVGFAIAAGALVTRSITRPVDQALRLATRVADGDLTASADGRGNDEVAALLRALGGMIGNLQGIVSRVRASSDSIASESAQIATENSNLSQRTELQSRSLEHAADTMAQLDDNIQKNANSATQAHQLAQGASKVAADGGVVVGEVIETMRDINESSRKIGEITSVIDGIAFQTNILALNAAVEAARAGEQGRGFAVVASEVRNLAQRCAAAAKEIKTLIDLSVDQVSRGSALVDRAGKRMEDIVESIERVCNVVTEITEATVAQGVGVHKIGTIVTQMRESTQSNAVLVEQSAVATVSLKSQADQLVEAMEVFKLSTPKSSTAVKAFTPVVDINSKRSSDEVPVVDHVYKLSLR